MPALEILMPTRDEHFRLAVENAIMDGIADARRAHPKLIPPDAEAIALATLVIETEE